MKPQDQPDFRLTKAAIEAEANRLLRLYRKARRGKAGPEPGWKMFITAGYLRLKKQKKPRARLNPDDIAFISQCFGYTPDPKLANRWIRGRAYRSAIERDGKEFTRWLGGPFIRAVGLVLAGFEGKPAPSRRELLRRFRIPGNKNSSAAELAGYREMINRMAAEIAETKPNNPTTRIDGIIDVPEQKNLRILQNGEDGFSGKKIFQGRLDALRVRCSTD